MPVKNRKKKKAKKKSTTNGKHSGQMDKKRKHASQMTISDPKNN